MTLGVAEIRAILDEGREAVLVDVAETDGLDFKEQPYALHDRTGDAHRYHAWELAKDAAAMANNPQGGSIVIGVRTEPSPTSSDDVAVETTPFPCSLVVAQQYKDIIAEHVHPPIGGVEVFKSVRGEKCFAVVAVPPQRDDDSFLLKKIVDPDGKPTEGFAMPVRDGSHTRWRPIEKIQREISDGRRSRRTDFTTFSGPSPVAPAQAALEERFRDDLTEIEDYLDWHDSAVYALAAAPVSPPRRIENFYGGDLRQNFAMPPELRHAGFGIGYRQEPTVEHGGLVAIDGDFRYRRLEPNGYFVVALRADENVLGRTSQAPTGVARSLAINVVALVEFTYEFCRFQRTILQPHIGSEWHLAVSLRGAVSRPWSLQLGLPYRRYHLWPEDAHAAQSDEMNEVIEAVDDHAANAYQLLAHVCDLFGLPESDLAPFVAGGRVDEEVILGLS